MQWSYNTRDANGKDITKTIKAKDWPAEIVDFICPICNKAYSQGVSIKKIVSSNFTEWSLVGDYICTDCAVMFNLFPFSYIKNGSNIRLLNIREMCTEIQREQETPSMIVISVSQKKHLFYKAVINQDSSRFIANLEEEQISCEINSLRKNFLFIGSLQALGESKKKISMAEISLSTVQKAGYWIFEYLNNALKTRQIQIPLYLSQKLNISEEEALCNLDLIRNR